LKRETLLEEFPTIYEKLAEVGIEMEKDWIPVVPAQHYSCGGIVTDLDGRTTVPGLYAAGEVACTGVHGGNRLASNSLLEAIVFATAAAQAAQSEPQTKMKADHLRQPHSIAEADALRIRRSLQRTMTQHVGIVRNDAGLREALSDVEALLAEYDSLPEAPFLPYALETRNLLVAAWHVAGGALARRENVGLHFNEDLEA
jgi:L-aspartate oxidase